MYKLGDRVEYLDQRATVIEHTPEKLCVLPDKNIMVGWEWSIDDKFCDFVKSNWSAYDLRIIRSEPLSCLFLEVATRHFLNKLNYVDNLVARDGAKIAKTSYSNESYFTQLKVVILNEIYEVLYSESNLNEKILFINKYIETEYNFNKTDGNTVMAISSELLIDKYKEVIEHIEIAC